MPQAQVIAVTVAPDTSTGGFSRVMELRALMLVLAVAHGMGPMLAAATYSKTLETLARGYR